MKNRRTLITLGVVILIVLVLCVVAAQSGLSLRELMLRAHGMGR